MAELIRSETANLKFSTTVSRALRLEMEPWSAAAHFRANLQDLQIDVALQADRRCGEGVSDRLTVSGWGGGKDGVSSGTLWRDNGSGDIWNVRQGRGWSSRRGWISGRRCTTGGVW